MLIFKTKNFVLNSDRKPALEKIFTMFQQLLGGNRIESNLIEELQEPWFARFEFSSCSEPIPNLNCTADKLITTWTCHPINTHVRTADAYRVFRGPCSGRIILGRYQAMSWIDGRCNRSAEVDVAKAQYMIA